MDSDRCPLCKSSSETVEHFIIFCPSSDLCKNVLLICRQITVLPELLVQFRFLPCDAMRGFAGEEASNESGVVENGDFRFIRSLSSEYFTYMATRQLSGDTTVNDLGHISRSLNCFTSNFSKTVCDTAKVTINY